MNREASARPERLANLAGTAAAIVEALTRRAGHLQEAWYAYLLANGSDWRCDFSGLDEALLAWAETLGGIGAFTGRVGRAFAAAGGTTRAGVVTVAQPRMLDLLPCDARLAAEEAEGTVALDWGDPDRPPAWLEDLATTSMVVGHLGEGVDATQVAFLAGTGADARWSPATPAVLGRFASAEAVTSFGTVLGVGAAGLSGAAAGVEQWIGDRGTLTFTDGEVAGRAITRGVGAGAAAFGGGLIGGAVASSLCGPGAPACAGVLVVGVGLGTAAGGDWVLDRVLGRPGPAEHDPRLVRDEVAGYEPGDRPGDVPDSTWDLIESVETQGALAGEAQFARRRGALFEHDIPPGVVDELELPAPWVEREARFPPGWARYRDLDGELVAP